MAFCGGRKDEAASSSHSHEGEAASHEHAEESEEPEKAQASTEPEHQHLDVTLEKQKAWGIIIGQARKQNISSTISLPGIVTLNQNMTAQITSFVHGQIASLSTDLGKKVGKGQPLIIINSPEFAQAQADFLRARTNFLLSQKEFERAKRLLAEQAIEEKEYLRREAEHQKLTTEYGALGSKLHSFGITHTQIEDLINKCTEVEAQDYKCEIADPHLSILSPVSGTVIFRDALKGEHIEPEKTLFTVSNLQTLWAILDAYEKDIPFIREKSTVHIYATLYPKRHFHGKISYISDTIDEKLRTVKVRVEVENPEGLLKPNMYIQGILENEAGDDKLLAIPEEAIQNMDGEKVVFVPEKADVFAVKHIKIGNKIGNQRIILSGLQEGDRLVIKGAFTLKTELAKGAVGQTHVH